MTDERRYLEADAAEIFRIAASERPLPGGSSVATDGFTLGELQAIGAEAGLAPERVAEAAGVLEARRGVPGPERLLGAPLSAARTVELPRAPTDREWALLLGEIRQSFGAAGRSRSDGPLREWTNGNLGVFIEASPGGYRLRMRTAKGDARSVAALGGVGVAAGIFFAASLLAQGAADASLVLPLLFGGGGIATLGANTRRLNRWAELRGAQMEHIGAFARALLETPPQE